MVEEKNKITFENRISGLAMLIFDGILTYNTNNNILDIGGAAFMIEGIGDLISGNHHHVSFNVLKYISRRNIDLIKYQWRKYSNER